jgi:hypothetical protein
MLVPADIPVIDLTYAQAELDAWVSGAREKWAQEPLPSHVLNQPKYHFAEYFVLAHFRALGWRGHRFYAIGDWEPSSAKLASGRADLARVFPPENLSALKAARIAAGRADGKGEPDLFLFRDDGASMFLEVKKDRDKLAPAQIECLRQIRQHLGSTVQVVRLLRTKN